MPTIRVPAMYDFSNNKTINSQKLANNGFCLMYVGNYKIGDGFKETLQAINIVRNYKNPVRLIVIGPKKSPNLSCKETIALCNQLRSQDAIVFKEKLSENEYFQYLNSADALILARKSGIMTEAAFPTRIPEFLATGKPVITSSVPDIPEYLKDLVHAHVVEPDNPEKIADRVISIIKYPNKATSLGRSGAIQAKACFDYRNHTKRVIDFVQTIC
jgi:glycosyltransferase involved in cell wall biosynthesis